MRQDRPELFDHEPKRKRKMDGRPTAGADVALEAFGDHPQQPQQPQPQDDQIDIEQQQAADGESTP